VLKFYSRKEMQELTQRNKIPRYITQIKRFAPTRLIYQTHTNADQVHAASRTDSITDPL